MYSVSSSEGDGDVDNDVENDLMFGTPKTITNTPKTITKKYREKVIKFTHKEGKRKRTYTEAIGDYCDSESQRVIEANLNGRHINEERRKMIHSLRKKDIDKEERKINELYNELVLNEENNIPQDIRKDIKFKKTEKGEIKYFIGRRYKSERRMLFKLQEVRYALEKIKDPQNSRYWFPPNMDTELQLEDIDDKEEFLQKMYEKECERRCEKKINEHFIFPFFSDVVDLSKNLRENPMRFYDEKDDERIVKKEYIKYINKYLNRLKNAREMPYNLDLEKIELLKTKLKNYFSFELKRIYNLLGNWTGEKGFPVEWNSKGKWEQHKCCACIDIYDEATKESEHFRGMYERGEVQSRCICSKLVKFGFAKQCATLLPQEMPTSQTTEEKPKPQENTEFFSDDDDNENGEWEHERDRVADISEESRPNNFEEESRPNNFEEEEEFDAGF